MELEYIILEPCVAIGLETGTYVVTTVVNVVVPVLVDVEVVEMLVSVIVRTFEGLEETPVILAETDPLPKRPEPEGFEPVPVVKIALPDDPCPEPVEKLEGP